MTQTPLDPTPTSRSGLRGWLLAAVAVAALVAFFALLPTPKADRPAADAAATDLPSDTFAVVGVRLFDGERVLPRCDVLVRDGRVAAVAEHLEIPSGVPTVDGAGRTLLPGLLDAHVHTWGDSLADALRFGVTTVFDMFTDPQYAAEVRRRQAADGNPGAADLFTAGLLATVAGGHGTQFPIRVPTVDPGVDADAWVAARLAEGSDYVKIILEDGSSLGHPIPTLSAARVAELAAAAHRHGVLAVAHVGSAAEARLAMEAGVDGLVHLFLDADPGVGTTGSVAHSIADAGAFVVPTLTVLESLAGGHGGAELADDPRLAAALSREQSGQLRRTFGLPPQPGLSLDNALDTTRRLATLGVPILAGSDAPNPGTAFGASLHRELELLVTAGLTPVEALTAATSAPADAFGLDDRGRVAPGLRADLLLVAGDPTTDVTATRDRVAVWKLGRPAPLQASEPDAAPGAAAPAVEAGLVSDFDDGLSARRGAGWQVSTDRRMHGESTAEIAAVDGHLQVTGEIAAGFPFPWAGAIYFPGDAPMQPVDLSALGGVAFRARGAGGPFRLMLLGAAQGGMPATASFAAGDDWRRVVVPLADLPADLDQVGAVLFSGGPGLGPFRLEIDDVELLASDADGGQR